MLRDREREKKKSLKAIFKLHWPKKKWKQIKLQCKTMSGFYYKYLVNVMFAILNNGFEICVIFKTEKKTKFERYFLYIIL